MVYDPEVHHRRSIRLRGYDYSLANAYYVTICVQDKLHLFGKVIDGKMALNDAGRMIERWYHELEHKFPDINCDVCVWMPNHVHFVVVNVGVGADLRVCPILKLGESGESNQKGEHISSMKRMENNQKGEHIGSPLRTVVQWFKTMTTNEYIRGVKYDRWRGFNGTLWQRNYYEHIVRNADDYGRIRDYIISNPMNWESDDLYSRE